MLSVTFKTLVKKEIKRFLKVYNQTLIAPIINSLLYFAIFTLVFKNNSGNFDYKTFVASGIVIMSMIQNSYANTQATITTAKVLGFSIDVIIPPISSFTLTTAILIGGIIRGLIIGIFGIFIFSFFVNFNFHNILLLLIYAIFACALFSLIGIIVGCFSKNFDAATSYNTYIINPLTFLSGTFYSITMLPEFWQKVILFNPVFYIIDGFRYSLSGLSEIPFNHAIPLLFLGFVISILTIFANSLIKTKYHEI